MLIRCVTVDSAYVTFCDERVRKKRLALWQIGGEGEKEKESDEKGAGETSMHKDSLSTFFFGCFV